MPACHTVPFVRPGVIVETSAASDVGAPMESCDYCGSPNIVWRKCKLICSDCKQINKSCADL